MKSRKFKLYGRTLHLTLPALFVLQFFHVFVTGFISYVIWLISPNIYVMLLVICFTTALPFHIGCGIMNILVFLALEWRSVSPSSTLHESLKIFSLKILRIYGKLFHGYEIHGKENLPMDSGGLLVYYHALLPFDAMYLTTDIYLEHRIAIGGIIHYVMYLQLHGFYRMLDFSTDGDQLLKDLKRGHLRSVSPGGDLEAVFSQNYELLWKNRVGFARIAKESGTPVIPMFAVNSGEAMPVRTFGLRGLLMAMLNRYGWVLFLPLICFPVKLRIIIGKPIFCGADESPERFAARVKAAICDLRDSHQRQPGSIFLAFLERFGYKPFSRTVVTETE